MSRELKIIGHRGLGMTSNGSPLKGVLPDENTLESFQAALDLGAHGLEFDICLSKDGHPVIIHPAMLERNPSDFTLAELKEIELPQGGEIPTLAETLDLIAKHREETGQDIVINAEFKGCDTREQGIVDASFEAIAPFLNTGALEAKQFVFNSFDWRKTASMKAYNPEFRAVPVALTDQLFDNVGPNHTVSPDEPIRSEVFDEILSFHEKTGGAFALDIVAKDLRPELIEFCKEHQIGIIVTALYPDTVSRQISPQLKMLIDAAPELPFAAARTDDIEDMFDLKEELQSSPRLISPSSEYEQSLSGRAGWLKGQSYN